MTENTNLNENLANDDSDNPKVLYQVLLEEYRALELLNASDTKEIEDAKADCEAKRDIKIEKVEKKREAKEIDKATAENEIAKIESLFRFEVLKKIRERLHFKQDDKRRPAALCLSGGGIRSATFCLGVLQGLAKNNLLSKFDYLSTVSGGGYIGSWLSAWIYHQKTEEEKKRTQQAAEISEETGKSKESESFSEQYVKLVEDKLVSTTAEKVESPEITYLRSYSNYMSPRPGLFSTDTWTLIAVYLRNLLLNWTVFLPLIAMFLMLPRFFGALINSQYGVYFQDSFGIFVTGVGIFGIANLTAMRPTLDRFSWVHQHYKIDEIGSVVSAEWKVKYLCLLPLLILAFGITAYWHWKSDKNPQLISFILYGELLFLGGFLASHPTILLRKYMKNTNELSENTQNKKPDKILRNFIKEFFISAAGGAIGGMLLYLFVYMFSKISAMIGERIGETTFYICFGAPLFLIAFLLSATFFVGVAGLIYDDMDREWISRFGAWILIVIVGWSVLSCVVLFGPEILNTNWIKTSSGIIGTISGFITLVLGFSRKSPATSEKEPKSKTSSLLKYAPQIAAPIFALFLIALISYGAYALMEFTGTKFSWMALTEIRNEPIKFPRLTVSLVWIIILAAIGFLMGWFININKYSLHAMYRERLIRAYLGASRAKERVNTANSFTDLDDKDNVQMKNLRHRPFHVINMTLNLGNTKTLRWQNRKAESFTATALHCGSSNMGDGSGNYRGSELYGYNSNKGEAITLGTAAAISGAAASPNMGYYTQSSAVSFLMALFNVRLGWWLGNPGRRGKKTYRHPSPSFSPNFFWDEALGNTDDTNKYVYLSDGGHFDNLGLYEMVLRRCHYIVACDAGADSKFGFSDLGTAIHKIRVDMGIPIMFEKGETPMPGRNCAIATIKYSAIDGETADDGILIYIKPTLDSDESIDIVNYKNTNPDFPHETTGDQMYSETQFESYRSLGLHMIESICCENKKSVSTSFEDLVDNAEKYLKKFSSKPDFIDEETQRLFRSYLKNSFSTK